MKVIRPQTVAWKIAAAANLEAPAVAEEFEEDSRLVELLWFIQWKSCQPGGLLQWSKDLVSCYPEIVSSRELRAGGSPQGAKWKTEQCLKAWKISMDGRLMATDQALDYHGGPWNSFADFEAWLKLNYDAIPSVSDVGRMRGREREGFLHAERQFGWQWHFDAAVCKTASNSLPRFLEDYCQDAHATFNQTQGNNLKDVRQVLYRYMDRWAVDGKNRVAHTSVATAVFESLDYAWSEKVVVQIEGDSRFGKSEAIKAWCMAYPGRARLVTVPHTSSVDDLIVAFAESFGLIFDCRSNRRELRDKVQEILKYCRLMPVLDEAAFLFPQRCSRNTAPNKLNWVRQHVMDRELPLAMVSTPQTYAIAQGRFIHATGYSIEQWVGRVGMECRLPDRLSAKDLLAVAKIHFPEMGEDYLRLIAAEAERSQNYLQAVEAIAKRARYLARKEGAESVKLKHIDQSISDVIPGTQKPSVRGKKGPSKPCANRTQQSSSINHANPPSTSGEDKISTQGALVRRGFHGQKAGFHGALNGN